MTRGRARAVVTYGGLVATLALAVGALVLYLHTRSTPVDFTEPRVVDAAVGAVAAAFAVVGAAILRARPDNRVGRLFWAVGLFTALGAFARQYAVYAVSGQPSPLWGGAAAAWLQSWSILSSLTTGVGLLLALFPDGRVLSPRWRIVPWAAVIGFACFAVGYTLDAGPVNHPFGSVSNPFAVPHLDRMGQILIPIGFFVSVVATVAAAISLVVRFRRASGVEREQIKWLAAAGAALAVSLAAVLNVEPFKTGEAIAASLLAVSLIAVPVAAGLAIFRYRLYEIDVVINRTLVYAPVTVLLAGTYVGLVLLFQLALRPLTGGNGLAVALSTLAVAALFRPARNRVQALVDRRFYRRKYDAERTLQAFAARVRDEVDLDSLRVELTAVAAETMQPAHVSLWLRDGKAPVTEAVTIPGRLLGTKERT
jgi:cytochrome b subunit of formate dehydrogenase